MLRLMKVTPWYKCSAESFTKALCKSHVGVRLSIGVSQKYYLKSSKEGADV